MPDATLAADQVPALRRELVENARTGDAADMYALMIALGRQPIRPPGPAPVVARLLASTEADRLERADLWHVDGDLADLVDAAYPTVPAFAPRPYDLPSRHGFVTFARPLTSMIRAAIPRDHVLAEALAATGSNPDAMRQVMTAITTGPVSIAAAAWGPVEESALAKVWPGAAGGAWFSFYSMPRSVTDPSLLDQLGEKTAASIRATRTTLTIDNELVVGWHPEGADPAKHLLSTEMGGTGAWGVAVFTAFLLARQGNVVEQAEERVSRPERRRYTRAGLAEPGPVRVLRLRRTVRDRAPQGNGSTSSREYRHRWVVRGHWRNQWYPSITAHRPKWIAPYLAGPDDAPLLGGDKVTRLAAPMTADRKT